MVLRRIILPNLVPAILTGSALAFARCIGEFGSVVLISGNIPYRTEVASVYIIGQVEADQPARGGGGLAVPAHLLAGRADRLRHPAAPHVAPRRVGMTSATRSSAAATGARAVQGSARRRAGHPAHGARRSRCCTCCCCSCCRSAMVFVRTFESGLDPFLKAISRPAFQSAFWLTVQITAHHGARSRTVAGHRHRAGHRATPVPRSGAAQRAWSTCRSRCRRWSSACRCSWSTAPTAPSARFLDGLGIRVIFAVPGHGAGHDLRVPAVRHPRGHPGAARDRHRPGGGGLHAGRVRSGAPSGG